MGQSFKKLTPAGMYEEKRRNVIQEIAEKYYNSKFEETSIKVDIEDPSQDNTKDIEEPSQHNTNDIEEPSQHNTNEIGLTTFSAFYQSVSETVEEINKRYGNTQFKLPDTYTLLQAYNQHHKTRKGTLTRKEFQKIVKELIEDPSFTGMGAKDILLYIFGVPFTTLLIKQRLVPARARSIPNEYFIPGITSLTVFILAKFHKI